MDDFSIIMVLCRIYTGLELFLLSGWIYCREGRKAGAGLVPPSGVVWWDDVDFCVPSRAKLLLERTLRLFIREHTNVWLYSSVIKAGFPEDLKVYIGLVGTRFLSMGFCVDHLNVIPLNTVPY